MQVLNKTEIMFRCEQIPHIFDFLDKREIRKYSEHYTVYSKS